MRQSKHSGSLWHNYKGFFSLVLLAICDARYCFSFVDVGEYGSNNDSGIFLNSEMGDLFRQGNLNIPPRSKISGSDYELSYFLVGDEIFPLQDWLMRPYAGSSLINELRKIFNYRLSRARRVIENTFGILVAAWRALQSPIDATPEKVEKRALACIALHNYLCQTDSARYNPTGFIDSEDSTGIIKKGLWREEANNGTFQDIGIARPRKHKSSAADTREALGKYFVSEVFYHGTCTTFGEPEMNKTVFFKTNIEYFLKGGTEYYSERVFKYFKFFYFPQCSILILMKLMRFFPDILFRMRM